MSEQSKEKQANEQAKAQNLFAKWRKDEKLYSDDDKKDKDKYQIEFILSLLRLGTTNYFTHCEIVVLSNLFYSKMLI